MRALKIIVLTLFLMAFASSANAGINRIHCNPTSGSIITDAQGHSYNCASPYFTYDYIGSVSVSHDGYNSMTQYLTSGDVYFNLTQTTMPVIFDVVGQGQFYVSRNGEMVGLATPNNPITVGYVIGDTISFIAYPYSGYRVSQVCDTPQTECRTEEYYSYTVIGQLPTKMTAWFVALSTPTPTPTPQPTSTPQEPLPITSNFDFEYWTNGISSAPDGFDLQAGGSVSQDVGYHGSHGVRLYSATDGIRDVHGVMPGINYSKRYDMGVWIKTSSSNRVYIQLSDTVSSYHSGSGDWEYISLTNITPHSSDIYPLIINAGSDISVLADYMTFIEHVDSTPTPTPTPSPTSTPAAMPLIFTVVGDGQMYAFRNGELEALATPGHDVTVTYNIGDAIAFRAYPYMNNYLVNVCDWNPYTECQTDNMYNYVVTGQLPEKMIATFAPNGTIPAYPVIFEVTGSGQMYAFKNGTLEGLATPGYPANVTYKIGDTISFTAYPYLNNRLISVCDVPFTECLSLNSYSYQVIGQLPIKMVATFESNSTVTPITPPISSSNAPGLGYYVSLFADMVSGNIGAFSDVPAALGLIISVGLIISAYIGAALKYGHDGAKLCAGLVWLITVLLGLFPIWIIALGIIVYTGYKYLNPAGGESYD